MLFERRRWRPVECIRVLVVVGFVAAFLVPGGLLAVGKTSLELDRNEAIRILNEEILPELQISRDYVAFAYPTVLGTSDELSPYAPNPIPADVMRLPHLVPYTIEGPAWFFWIDLEPYARYSHPTRFVLVDASDGSYVVHDEGWWPVLNGELLWTDPGSYWNEKNWVSAQVTLPKGNDAALGDAGCGTTAPRANCFDWALVVNGWVPGEPGEQQFRADAEGMCRAFNSMGMKLSTLLPGEASPEAVETFIVKLFTELRLYTCCERLYFYFACHASPGALWIGGQRLSSSELARMLSNPGNTYVPSRVYVYIDSCFAGSFIPELTAHSNVMRVWTTSGTNEVAYNDLDPANDPNPHDAGGEWTSSLVETLEELLFLDESQDPLAVLAVNLRRYYVALNRALLVSSAKNAAVINGLSHPEDYLFSAADPDYLCECATFLAQWDRDAHMSRGRWESTIELHRDNRCEPFLRLLNHVGKHNAAPPSPKYHLWTGKQCARDLSHSDFWDYCDVYWDVFSEAEDAP